MSRSEEVLFRAGDASLSGTLLLPDGDDRRPWALLIGSWLPRDRDGGWGRDAHPGWYADPATDEPPGLLARLADALAERGVASFRHDPRAWEATDLFTRIDDARDAIGAMRSRRELDLRRTAIVGHGEGAIAAISVAISDPAIGAVGLVGSPARSWRDVLRRGVAERARSGIDRQHPVVAALDGSSEELIERAERRESTMPLAIGADSVTLSLAGTEQAIHTPALALVTMLRRNVLIVHGSEDAWSHPDEAALLATTLSSAGAGPVVELVDGAGHDLAEAGDDRIGDIAEALTARMEPRELPAVLVAIEQMGGDG